MFCIGEIWGHIDEGKVERVKGKVERFIIPPV